MKKNIILLTFFMLAISVSPTWAAKTYIFTLVNASTNNDLYELNDSDNINLASHSHLNVRLDVSFSNVGKVIFELDGSNYNTETIAPYTLAGDSNGNYKSWTPSAGTHTLRVHVFNKSGNWLGQQTIRFTVTGSGPTGNFRKTRGDLISLHYDHANDPDDGHSCAADRTVASRYRLLSYVHIVSGTYGDGMRGLYQTSVDKVNDAAWGENTLEERNWVDAYENWYAAVAVTAEKWRATLNNGKGGHVWVKEGGPSDFTADVLRKLYESGGPNPITTDITKKRVHVIQHGPKVGGGNENNTDPDNLEVVKNNTAYIKIANGNYANETARLRILQSDRDGIKNIKAFMVKAKAHRFAGNAWKAAFNYFQPIVGQQTANWPYGHYLDFSDTVELLYILNIYDIENVADFANKFFS